MMYFYKCFVVLAVWCVASSVAEKDQSPMTSGVRMLRNIYDNCQKSEEIVKCLKLQAFKMVSRAINTENITVAEGLSFVKTSSAEGRAFSNVHDATEEEARSMPADQLDSVLADKAARFLSSHQVSLNMANLFGSTDSDSVGRMIEEGRGKLKKYIGPILTALAIKGSFVAMAFQAIAMISGKALLIGKIALVLSAIIGLKKLVSGDEAHEKTTYEIVKHPQVTQSHSYSSSHFGGGNAGEYEATGPGGHYRSYNEEKAQDRAFRAHVPRS